jgi:hypothetical protein
MFRNRRRIFHRRGLRWNKFAVVWSLLLLFALYFHLSEYCKSLGQDCQELALSWLSLICVAIALLSALFIVRKFLYILRERTLNQTPGFFTQPWKFDNKIVQLTGKVAYVFSDKPTAGLRIFLTNIWRKIVASSDPSARYRHQRFLLSSPDLRNGESIMVISNLSYDIPRLGRGDSVEVQGVYVHTPSPKRSFWGTQRTFYGRIHYTHPPKGYLKKVS